MNRVWILVSLDNYTQKTERAYQIQTNKFENRSNNYGKIFLLLVGCLSFERHPLSSADTKSGFKSKLLCRQQMSFKICLQSRNVRSFWIELVHNQHNVALMESALWLSERYQVKGELKRCLNFF